MRAGQLRTQVQIEKAVEARDAHGQPIATWQLLAARWCGIESTDGSETPAAQLLQAKVTHRIRMRSEHLPRRITPKDRITAGARIFEIVSVIEHREKDRELEILVFEMV